MGIQAIFDCLLQSGNPVGLSYRGVTVGLTLVLLVHCHIL